MIINLMIAVGTLLVFIAVGVHLVRLFLAGYNETKALDERLEARCKEALQRPDDEDSHDLA